MSKKILEYFKVTPKSQNLTKHNCDIKIEENIEVSDNLSVIRDCKVIIKDIKNQIPKNLQLSETFELNCSQNIKTTKIIRKKKKICKFCNMKLSCLSSIQHIKSLHSIEANLLSCTICNRKFFEEKYLNLHLKNKHPDGKIKHFECDFDGKIFKTKGLLCTHMRGHLPLVKCEICNKMLKTVCIKAHLKSFHATGRKFQCKICSKMFKTLDVLRRHEKIHNKKTLCEICLKMFAGNHRLNTHIKDYHNNASKYYCEICNREFKVKASLKNHKKTHDKNRLKPFKCQRCDYSNDCKRDFNKHQKFHERQDKKFATMINPIKCEKCPTFHRNKESLKNHMRNVHPKVKFQCDLCAKFIKIKKNLICHMKIHVQKTKSNL